MIFIKEIQKTNAYIVDYVYFLQIIYQLPGKIKAKARGLEPYIFEAKYINRSVEIILD